MANESPNREARWHPVVDASECITATLIGNRVVECRRALPIAGVYGLQPQKPQDRFSHIREQARTLWRHRITIRNIQA